MAVINGRYHMNLQYGTALERARAAAAQQKDQEPSWLGHFLGLVPTDEEQEL